LGRFPAEIARYFFRQILEGLENIHGSGMYHGDLKPENLLLNQNYNLKLADFGFAETESADIKQFRGTEGYMAPEILARVPYSGQAADIFAACVILFIMLAGRPPFVRAIPTDPHYKPMALGSIQRFWAA
jgi:serine/threonine protein kinase